MMDGRKAWFRTLLFVLLLSALLVTRHLRPLMRQAPVRPPGEEVVRVVATIFPLSDFARQVGGDKVRVRTLLPAGASPHTFEPTPRQIREMRDTGLLIKVGAGLDTWAEQVVAASESPRLKRVVVSRELSLIRDMPGHDHGDHRHDEGNPHVWLDPVLAMEIVRQIAEALAVVDPENAGFYHGRGESYREELELLHREILETTAGFTIKKYVAFHPAWTYFGARYGLEEAGVIIRSPSREPLPREIKAIVDAVREHGIKAVFAEPQFPEAAARAIAGDAGVPVLFLDPLGGPDIPGRDNYLDLMRHNLAVMEEAMKDPGSHDGQD